jgi:hypothetical protein
MRLGDLQVAVQEREMQRRLHTPITAIHPSGRR